MKTTEKPQKVVKDESISKIPKNFTLRYQNVPKRFYKNGGIKREYTFSEYDNRPLETRNTRKDLQWDHRKVYQTPNFMVIHLLYILNIKTNCIYKTWNYAAENDYRTTSSSSYVRPQISQMQRTPTWTRFPKLYNTPKEPVTPTLNSRQFISTF